MKVDGACHCGKISFEAEVDSASVGICHCIDCQTLSGSPFRTSIITPAASFKLLGGSPKIYVKTADSGNRRAHGFCADCGSPIFATAEHNPTSYTLRVGAIRQRAQLRPVRQIWCRSALPWALDISGVARIEGQP